jgi:hypothetical protein
VALFSTGKSLVFGGFTRLSRRVVDEALFAVDEAPGARRLFVIDLPAASALAFPHAVRLERPHRHIQVEVLSLAPHFVLPVEHFESTVHWADDQITVRAVGRPYLGSYIERAYLAERKPLLPGASITRCGYDVTVLEADDGLLNAFRVDLHPGVRQRALVLRGQGYRLVPLRLDDATWD